MSETPPNFKLDPSKNLSTGEDIFEELVITALKKIKKYVWYVLFPIFLFGFFAGAWIF